MTLVDELERLDALRSKGVLDEEEFQLAKFKILEGNGKSNGVWDHDFGPQRLSGGEPNVLQRLSRSRTDFWFGGVCGGLAAETPVPAWCWRLLFTLGFFAFGFGLIPYVLMWIFIPREGKV